MWFYETSTLLFSSHNRTDFISWCKARAVTQVYLDAFGLPGCDANGNATTGAAFRALVAELHSSKMDRPGVRWRRDGERLPKRQPEPAARPSVHHLSVRARCRVSRGGDAGRRQLTAAYQRLSKMLCMYLDSVRSAKKSREDQKMDLPQRQPPFFLPLACYDCTGTRL